MSGDLQLNGIAVHGAKIELVRVGRWTADLRIDSTDIPTGSVTLTSQSGLSLKGFVRRGGEFVEFGHLHVVGGAGGLEGEAPPVYYRSVTVRTPLQALLSGLGETLSPTSDTTALGTFLERWTRERGHGGPALARLAEAAGVGWRVLDDGTIWLGNDTFADSGIGENEYDLLADHPSEHRAVIASEQILANLRPGTTFRGNQVAFVEHLVEGTRTTTNVWYERNAPSSHPVLGPLQSVIRDTMRQTRYHAIYGAKVYAQGTDDSLDVILDDPDMPHMTGVPLQKFAPGITVKVASGSRVQIGFEGGDPSKPLALLFGSGTTTEVPVKTCGDFQFIAATNQLTIRYTKPNGSIQNTVIAFAATGGVVVSNVSGGTANLEGRIAS